MLLNHKNKYKGVETLKDRINRDEWLEKPKSDGNLVSDLKKKYLCTTCIGGLVDKQQDNSPCTSLEAQEAEVLP